MTGSARRFSILLVNPPVYDFSAHDFWLRPYGLLTVGGWLRGRAEVCLFDYLDRAMPGLPPGQHLKSDAWGRGKFYNEIIPTPAVFRDIRRRYRRFGAPREMFRRFLAERGPFDVALVQTVMTYWYPGVREVIEDLRAARPATRIVLGGVYATLCPDHAQSLGADLVVQGSDFGPLEAMLGGSMEGRRYLTSPFGGGDEGLLDREELPFWEGYPRVTTGVMKLSDGCPFRCTYCSVASVYGGFRPRPMARCVREFRALVERGATDIAFYDDALLYRSDEVLSPFLDAVQEGRAATWGRPDGTDIRFHTPNGLNARFVTADLARQMVAAGFTTFHLGFESRSEAWQAQTGSKVRADEFREAARHLIAAGADPRNIVGYVIVGHPDSDGQEIEESLRFVHDCGVRVMLAEFAPVPGTPDGERCRAVVDMAEPLNHNKTAFARRRLGAVRMMRLNEIRRRLNAAP